MLSAGLIEIIAFLSLPIWECSLSWPVIGNAVLLRIISSLYSSVAVLLQSFMASERECSASEKHLVLQFKCGSAVAVFHGQQEGVQCF